MTSQTPLLDIRNLRVQFDTELGLQEAVRDVSLQVNKGEILAIVGESGSGKSVTALSILHLLPSSTVRYPSGEILFHHQQRTIDLLRQPTRVLQSIRGNEIAVIFQEPMTSLNPVITVGEQVMEALRLHKKLSKREAWQETLRLFEKVRLPHPQHLIKRFPHQLSGGQKQRVMIALAMSCQPALLICDEPTTALDVTVQRRILELLRSLQQETGMGIIFITHDLGVVAEIADRAIVMYKGAIVEQGTVEEIFRHPQQSYTRALLACRPALHPKGQRLPVVSDFLELDSRNERERAIQTENKIEAASDTTTANEVILSVEDLVVEFAGKRNFFGKTLDKTRAVDRVSFEVYKGEVLGLVGESGCGKTTLGRAILRLQTVSSGKIRFRGEDITAKSVRDIKPIRKDLQIVFQDPFSSLNPRLKIGQAIAEPLRVHGLEKSSRHRKERVVELLEKVDLKADHYDRYPHEFSGGQRQRIVIARALALQPSFIVCDESVSALDVSVQAQVLNLLGDLKREFGFTIIFISHDLSVVHYLSDRIMVMNKGKIEELGPADDIYRHPGSEYTRNLLESIPSGKIGQREKY